MFKVGDEVYVKGTIKKIVNGVMYPFHVEFAEMEHGHFLREELYKADKTYEQGLADAWEFAKKITTDEKSGGVSGDYLMETFGTALAPTIFSKFTAEEALAEIEAYEEEKEIKVGDVVTSFDREGVVVNVQGKGLTILHCDGLVSVMISAEECKKTGKHIDIESLLRQIGE